MKIFKQITPKFLIALTLFLLDIFVFDRLIYVFGYTGLSSFIFNVLQTILEAPIMLFLYLNRYTPLFRFFLFFSIAEYVLLFIYWYLIVYIVAGIWNILRKRNKIIQ